MTTATSTLDNKHYRFGEWQFDPSDGTLKSKQSSARLQPQLAKLLTLFVENVGVLLTRNSLIEALWQDKSVNEDALSRCIAELRATLGDNSSAPIYIETVPKKGYRFIHPLNDIQQKKSRVSVSLGSIILLAIVAFTAWHYYPLNQPSSNSSSNQAQMATLLTTAVIAAKRITADSAVEYQPELSSLGDKIVFSVSQQQKLMIKVMTTSGELLQQISDPDSHLYSATFSPDDQWLLLVSLNDTSCQIFRYQLATLQRELIASCSQHYLPSILDWSPDGKSMAYVAKSQHSVNEAIWTYQFSSKQHLQITFPNKLSTIDSRPRFSSDSKKLSFLRGTNSINNIYMIDLDDPSKPVELNNLNSMKAATALTNGHGYIDSFAWLANQRHIIYDSNELGQKNLWLFDIQSKTQELLGARDGQFPSLNRSNTLLAHQEIQYNANIWKVDISKADAAAEKIIESIKYNNFPTYSPNGEQIAFVSNRQGRAAIWLYDSASDTQQRLMTLPKLDLVSPSWSMDGQRMLVSSRGENGYRCYQLNLATAAYQILSAIIPAHYGCAYASTGDILAIEKEALSENRLLKFDSAGTLHVLTEFGVGRFQLTDRDLIVFSYANETGLYAMDLDGKNTRTLLADFNHDYDGNWAVQGSYLYYVKMQDAKGIWQRNLLTDEEKLVTAELPTAIGLTMSVSPDHSQLLLAKTDSRLSDIYISDLSQLKLQD